MKKIIIAVFLLIGFMAMGTSPEAVRAADPIIIGAAVDQSNLFSAWDIPAMRALEYALDEQNKKGGINGRELKLIKGNTKSDITIAGQVALDLIDQGAQLLLIS